MEAVTEVAYQTCHTHRVLLLDGLQLIEGSQNMTFALACYWGPVQEKDSVDWVDKRDKQQVMRVYLAVAQLEADAVEPVGMLEPAAVPVAPIAAADIGALTGFVGSDSPEVLLAGVVI